MLLTRLKGIHYQEKFNAFLVHFSISLAIFFVLGWLIYFHWYPVPFFTTDGGWQGLRLIAFVDLVLGPTLTFIVFKRGKPSLKFDLTLIAVAQMAALVWGIWVVQSEKPVAVVFAEESFRTIPRYQFIEAGLELKDLKRFGNKTPVKIFVEIPDGHQERLKLYEHIFKSKEHLFLKGDLYRPLTEKNKSKISEKQVNMTAFLADKPKDQVKFRRYIDKIGKKESNFLFIPFLARFNYYFLVIDKKTWEFAGLLDIRPPQFYPRTINANRSKK